MDISSALSYLRADDATQNAAKFPAWAGGYVYKTTTGLTEQEVAAGKHRMVFVHADGDQYIYKWDGVADYGYEGYLEHGTSNALADISSGSPVSGTALPFDADFLEAAAANSWEIGAQATFEGRRTGGGLW